MTGDDKRVDPVTLVLVRRSANDAANHRRRAIGSLGRRARGEREADRFPKEGSARANLDAPDPRLLSAAASVRGGIGTALCDREADGGLICRVCAFNGHVRLDGDTDRTSGFRSR
jgi:hypothetical protein